MITEDTMRYWRGQARLFGQIRCFDEMIASGCTDEHLNLYIVLLETNDRLKEKEGLVPKFFFFGVFVGVFVGWLLDLAMFAPA